MPRLAVESLVVVLSVLLALAADEWWDRRETRAAVTESLRSIQAEIVQNRARLQEVAPYHRNLADTLQRLAAAGATRVEPDLHARGWLVTRELTAAAWNGARTSGTTSEMAPRTVLLLSDVYQKQAAYLARREAIMPVIYAHVLERGSADLEAAYRPLAGIIGDVASWEAALLVRYEEVLEGWPGDSEEDR